ncbi:MAG: GNAT family N-acetyltransferase [Myxococcota bacterium]|nr:GNAT family N-acetyltransferase [Myxococcota bacterium]
MSSESVIDIDRVSIVRLDSHHQRDSFFCGDDALDGYLKKQASQDQRRNFATVFLFVHDDTGEVFGFYTLAAMGVPQDLVPEKQRKKWPRYQMVPSVLLGRLAVATKAQGHGLGRILLLDAIRRTLQAEVAWAAIVVDAKDDKACSFYRSYDFQPFLDDSNHLYLLRETAERLFE